MTNPQLTHSMGKKVECFSFKIRKKKNVPILPTLSEDSYMEILAIAIRQVREK